MSCLTWQAVALNYTISISLCCKCYTVPEKNLETRNADYLKQSGNLMNRLL